MNRVANSWMVGGLFLFALGCAHNQTTPSPIEVTNVAPKEVESFHLSDPEPPQVVDQELEVIPEEMNGLVDQWVHYFQFKGRPHMERYLARSTRYMTLMKRILRQNGLPEDLIYIALIESGFSAKATSRAAAVGYWQFIKGTGKRYGLEISSLVDERRDPVLATQAAAEYFKGLYSAFGSWYLSMASYNVGENRVKREVMAHFTRDFWELARKRRFPKETINYVPKFIAARMIAKNPSKYGFTDIEYEPPIEFEMIKVDKPLNLRVMASKMGLEYEDFKQLNPKFRGEIAPPKAGGILELRVPVGQMSVAMNAAHDATVDKVEMIADAGDTTTYKIRRGDSLYTVARKFHTSVSVIRDINDLKTGRKLRVGMHIQVPERTTKKTKVIVARQEKQEKVEKVDDSERATTNPEIVKNGVTFYIVQPGDTLSAIADDYDSSLREIRKMNHMGKGGVLKVGMRLKVPKDEGLPSAPDAVKNVAASSDEPGSNSAAESPADVASKKDEADVMPSTATPKAAAASASAIGDSEAGASSGQAKNSDSVSKTGSTDVAKDSGSRAEKSSVKSGDKTALSEKSNSEKEPIVGRAKNRADANAAASSAKEAGSTSRDEGRDNSVASKRDEGRDAKESAASNSKRGDDRDGGKNASASAGDIDDNGQHTVRAGESLTTIAHKYGVTIDAIRKANNLKHRSVLRAGTKLLIPQDRDRSGSVEGGARRPSTAQARTDRKSRVRALLTALKHRPSKVHVVRAGESLTQIAARYGVSLQSITRHNKLKPQSKVFVGARLLIPLAEAAQ